MSSRILLAVGGDVFPNGRFFGPEGPISSSFSEITAKLASADVFFANYEMPLSTRGRPLEKLANIRADPAIAEDLARVGFDIVSLANNHMMDFGTEALEDTIANLRAQGIPFVGAGMTRREAVESLIFEVAGRSIGFLAFTCLVAPGAGATSEDPGVAALHVHSSYEINPYWQAEEPGEPAIVTIHTFADAEEQRLAEEAIAVLRERVDFVCLSLHWGYGGLSGKPAEYQRPLAHALIDAGADIIMGNHPHAVQGVELYEGKAILYSPGAFIGRQMPATADGEVSELVQTLLDDMSPDGYLTFVTLDENDGYDVEFVPTSLDQNGLPQLAVGDTHERIVRRMSAMSAKLGTQLDVRQDGVVVIR